MKQRKNHSSSNIKFMLYSNRSSVRKIQSEYKIEESPANISTLDWNRHRCMINTKDPTSPKKPNTSHSSTNLRRSFFFNENVAKKSMSPLRKTKTSQQMIRPIDGYQAIQIKTYDAELKKFKKPTMRTPLLPLQLNDYLKIKKTKFKR